MWCRILQWHLYFPIAGVNRRPQASKKFRSSGYVWWIHQNIGLIRCAQAGVCMDLPISRTSIFNLWHKTLRCVSGKMNSRGSDKDAGLKYPGDCASTQVLYLKSPAASAIWSASFCCCRFFWTLENHRRILTQLVKRPKAFSSQKGNFGSAISCNRPDTTSAGGLFCQLSPYVHYGILRNMGRFHNHWELALNWCRLHQPLQRGGIQMCVHWD